jgi:hypothetical protein
MNPKCNIYTESYNESSTISNGTMNYNGRIYGYSDSTAEA